MSKIKRFDTSVLGEMLIGKDPLKIVRHFLLKKGHDPDKTIKEETNNSCRWMIDLSNGYELEIYLDKIRTPSQATVYMGINILPVPIRGSLDFLVSVLEIADGLIGAKLGLVGYFIILSVGLGAERITYEELDYNYRLILAQKDWVKEAILNEFEEEDIDV
ncbi:MAG: hypothetical protein ACOX3T_06255 [Bdellovibrionota bacterium]